MKPKSRAKPAKPITKARAKQIAVRVCTPSRKTFACYDALPPGCNIYSVPQEPCWFIRCPWGDGLRGKILRDSRLVIISRRTGRVLYHGSACDEG